MSAALLASELAETVVATALPTIAADLGDLRLLALVTTGYLVTSTAVLPAYGWLSDRYGRRRLFVVAVAVFLLGSVLGALATGPASLVVARLVQGCGAGGLLVLVQAEVAVLVPLRQRAAVMSGVGAVFAAAVDRRAAAGRLAGLRPGLALGLLAQPARSPWPRWWPPSLLMPPGRPERPVPAALPLRRPAPAPGPPRDDGRAAARRRRRSACSSTCPPTSSWSSGCPRPGPAC